MRAALSPARLALAVLVTCGPITGALARQDQDTAPASRTEASQIDMPATAPVSGPGSAYLDPVSRPPAPPQPRASLVQTGSDQISRGSGNAPASQISARGQGGSGMAQLSRADLEATLAQLSPAERRVLLQAIEGSDICDNPPNIAAIVTLCQTRLETRSSEFGAASERLLSAEDSLLAGDIETSALPTVDRVIERLARGGASSGDLSNQAIASIALGSSAPTASRPGDEEQPDTASFSEEAQALINALINQLGGRAP